MPALIYLRLNLAPAGGAKVARSHPYPYLCLRQPGDWMAKTFI